jgi:hypothetical protein
LNRLSMRISITKCQRSLSNKRAAVYDVYCEFRTNKASGNH